MFTAVSVPDLHLLRVFVAITEAGGFSAAQIALNVSQSTISTQMAELETRLGLILCRRGRSGFSLTDDGHAVYEAAKHFFHSCDDFAGKVNARRGGISGELRIALADALLGNPDFPVQEIFQETRRRMPAVSLMLSQADPLTIERQILDERIHAGIHTFPNHAPGLRYTKLFTETQTLYCAKGHPLYARKDKDITTAEIEEFDYVARTYYGGSLKPGVFRPKRVTGQSSSMEGTVALILSGAFIGHLPMVSARPWVDGGDLRALRIQDLSYPTIFECTMAVGAHIVRPLEIFEAVLNAHFSESRKMGRENR